MLTQAAAANPGPAITYAQADLEHLSLQAAAFDLIYSSLALHYVKDLTGLLRTVHQAMVDGAHLVFSIEHPIYMAPVQPRWLIAADDSRSWPVDHYLIEGPRITDWLAPGVIKQHRTIGTTVNLLINAGFTVCHVEEWSPTDQQIAAHPPLAQERERPMFLLVAAQR
jgi:SAM-dependent methyltransferase